VAAAGIITVVRLWPITELASEFMPDLDEGDLMCLPTALPAVSAGKTQGGHEARRGTPPVVVPVTLAIIVLLLYLKLRNFAEVAMLMASLPFALIGGIWLLYLLDYYLTCRSRAASGSSRSRGSPQAVLEERQQGGSVANCGRSAQTNRYSPTLVMSTLQEAEKLIAGMTRAEKAQLLQWVVRDLGGHLPRR
jgi:hypothetical protein